MTADFISNYRDDALRSFRSYKTLAERAIEQVSDEEFVYSIDSDANSIALIVKHIAGNLHSRWSYFLTADGEKGTRDRDTEFELIGDSRKSLLEFWETGWQTLFGTIEPLTIDDFSTVVTIRSEPHSVVEAINRQLTHYAYHVGQIVLLAKHFREGDWQTLSVPRGRSAQYNRFLQQKQADGTLRGDRMEVAHHFATEDNTMAGEESRTRHDPN